MSALAHELFATTAVAGRICAGLVFVLAATHKAQHWRIFFGVVANYRLLPHVAVAPVASLLPPVELALGLLLLSAQARPLGELAAIALLALFAAAMAINIRRGREAIDCGCGQSFLRQTLRWALVWRNGGLAALLLPSLLEAGPASMAMLLTGAAAGLVLFLLYLLLNILAALPGTRRFA
jgi:hypothetical protein